jgi:hypothetical protein
MAIAKNTLIYQVNRGVVKGHNGQTKASDLVNENWIAYHSFEHGNEIGEREITGFVLETMPTVNIDFTDGRRVKCSTNQIFYKEGGTWVCHDPAITESTDVQIQVGDKCLDNTGAYVEVSAIGVVDDHELLHISYGGAAGVNDNNNYFAQGICVGRFNRSHD